MEDKPSIRSSSVAIRNGAIIICVLALVLSSITIRKNGLLTEANSSIARLAIATMDQHQNLRDTINNCSAFIIEALLTDGVGPRTLLERLRH